MGGMRMTECWMRLRASMDADFKTYDKELKNLDVSQNNCVLFRKVGNKPSIHDFVTKNGKKVTQIKPIEKPYNTCDAKNLVPWTVKTDKGEIPMKVWKADYTREIDDHTEKFKIKLLNKFKKANLVRSEKISHQDGYASYAAYNV